MKESQYLNAWLWEFHRDKPTWKRVRLGLVPDPAQASMLKVVLRWADAVLLDGDTIVIVEAKLRNDLGLIGQLKGYKELFKHTPEFSKWRNSPIRLVALVPEFDATLFDVAQKEGIEYIVWHPDDAEKIIHSLAGIPIEELPVEFRDLIPK